MVVRCDGVFTFCACFFHSFHSLCCPQFETTDGSIMADGLGVLIQIPDGLTRWNTDSSLFPILSRTEYNQVPACVAFSVGQDVSWSCLDLKSSPFLFADLRVRWLPWQTVWDKRIMRSSRSVGILGTVASVYSSSFRIWRFDEVPWWHCCSRWRGIIWRAYVQFFWWRCQLGSDGYWWRWGRLQPQNHVGRYVFWAWTNLNGFQ